MVERTPHCAAAPDCRKALGQVHRPGTGEDARTGVQDVRGMQLRTTTRFTVAHGRRRGPMKISFSGIADRVRRNEILSLSAADIPTGHAYVAPVEIVEDGAAADKAAVHEQLQTALDSPARLRPRPQPTAARIDVRPLDTPVRSVVTAAPAVRTTWNSPRSVVQHAL